MVATVYRSEMTLRYFANEKRMQELLTSYQEVKATSEAFYEALEAAGFTRDDVDYPNEVLDAQDISNYFYRLYRQTDIDFSWYKKQVVTDDLAEVIKTAFVVLDGFYHSEVELMEEGKKFKDNRTVKGDAVVKVAMDITVGNTETEEKIEEAPQEQSDKTLLGWFRSFNLMELDFLQSQLSKMEAQLTAQEQEVEVSNRIEDCPHPLQCRTLESLQGEDYSVSTPPSVSQQEVEIEDCPHPPQDTSLESLQDKDLDVSTPPSRHQDLTIHQLIRDYVAIHQPCTVEQVIRDVLHFTTVNKVIEVEVGALLRQSGCIKVQRRVNGVKAMFWELSTPPTEWDEKSLQDIDSNCPHPTSSGTETLFTPHETPHSEPLLDIDSSCSLPQKPRTSEVLSPPPQVGTMKDLHSKDLDMSLPPPGLLPENPF